MEDFVRGFTFLEGDVKLRAKGEWARAVQPMGRK